MIEPNAENVVKALEKLGTSKVQAYRLFGLRGAEGWRLMIEGKVKKYNFTPFKRHPTFRWRVGDEGKDHTVEPVSGFCDCDDYYFTVMNGEALAWKN